MPRESAILKRARALLETGTGYCIKTSGDGEPDLVCSVNGRSVVCETKQPGEKPTPLQYAKLRRWAESGAAAYWYNGEHWVKVWSTADGMIELKTFGKPREINL